MLGLMFFITLLVTSVFLLIYIALNENKIVIKNRLERYTTGNASNDYKETEVTKVGKKNEKVTFVGIIGNIVPLDKYFEKKKILLSRARLLIKPEELLGICIIIGLILGIILYLLFDGFILVKIIVFIFGFLIGFQIPIMYVKNVKKSRAKKLNNQLPVALSVLANGLRAGLSFNQSMVIAAKEMEPPISDDFNKVVHDNVLGKDMEEALKDFAERTDDEDVEILVTAVLIQRQVGGNLSEILDTISNTIRERVKLKGDIRTMTAQAKLSALVVGGIPFFIVIILYLLNKDFMMPLFTTLIGNVLLGIALLMQAIGIFILVKLLDLKV
ncbi:MAG: type II secretion system F family protein [Firmicutes bacterium]|nr:type II secretion system F family protein [Bacillota bacterium]